MLESKYECQSKQNVCHSGLARGHRGLTWAEVADMVWASELLGRKGHKSAEKWRVAEKIEQGYGMSIQKRCPQGAIVCTGTQQGADKYESAGDRLAWGKHADTTGKEA